MSGAHIQLLYDTTVSDLTGNNGKAVALFRRYAADLGAAGITGVSLAKLPDTKESGPGKLVINMQFDKVLPLDAITLRRQKSLFRKIKCQLLIHRAAEVGNVVDNLTRRRAADFSGQDTRPSATIHHFPGPR
jgi:hypothetical protein